MIDETLSPTWDELLVFEEVLVYGRREDIKANPPIVIIEIYDQDKASTSHHIDNHFCLEKDPQKPIDSLPACLTLSGEIS